MDGLDTETKDGHRQRRRTVTWREELGAILRTKLVSKSYRLRGRVVILGSKKPPPLSPTTKIHPLMSKTSKIQSNPQKAEGRSSNKGWKD